MTVTEESAHQGTLAEIALGLRRWYRGESDRRTANRLTAVAVEIVLQSYGLRRRICAAAAAGGTTPAQIALSLLAELFVGAGPESRLGLSLRDVVDSDDSALYSKFRSVVQTVARQELFHRWVLEDPLAARLWKRLHRVIRDDRRIMVFPADRPEWIAAVSIEPSVSLDLVDQSTLDRVVSSVFRPNMNTADFVAAVIEYLNCRDKVISVDDLFEAIRQCITLAKGAALEEETSPMPPDLDYALAVEKAISAVTEEIGFIVSGYIRAGKLPPDTAAKFSLALVDLVTDWGEGAAASQYEYLHTHCPWMTYEEYRQTYRKIFEYLAEKAKERFFDQMRRYFVEKDSARPPQGD